MIDLFVKAFNVQSSKQHPSNAHHNFCILHFLHFCIIFAFAVLKIKYYLICKTDKIYRAPDGYGPDVVLKIIQERFLPTNLLHC